MCGWMALRTQSASRAGRYMGRVALARLPVSERLTPGEPRSAARRVLVARVAALRGVGQPQRGAHGDDRCAPRVHGVDDLAAVDDCPTLHAVHDDRGGMRRSATAAVAAALTLGAAAAPASAARPVEGYHDAGNRVGCVMYQNFNSDGNAVKCGRRGGRRGLLLRSAGPSRKLPWRWPARTLERSFFTATYGQTLYLYGGTAKLEGDSSTLRCTFHRRPAVRGALHQRRRLCNRGNAYAGASDRAVSLRSRVSSTLREYRKSTVLHDCSLRVDLRA